MDTLYSYIGPALSDVTMHISYLCFWKLEITKITEIGTIILHLPLGPALSCCICEHRRSSAQHGHHSGKSSYFLNECTAFSG